MVIFYSYVNVYQRVTPIYWVVACPKLYSSLSTGVLVMAPDIFGFSQAAALQPLACKHH